MGLGAAIMLGAVAMAGASVYGASQDQPEPPKPPEPPTPEEAGKAGKEAMEDRRRVGAVGKQATKSAGLLTEEAETEKKTLLGG